MNIQVGKGFRVEFDDVGKGKPVVLLHSFPLNRKMWQPQIDELQKEFRIIAPDLRGFGGSGPFEGTPSIRRMADDVHGLLKALKIEDPVVLGGLSMGGYVALAFARKYHATLAALVL